MRVRHFRRFVAAFALASSFFNIRSALAQQLHLSWRAPAECPSEEQVKSAVVRAAAQNRTNESVAADVLVEHTGERWMVSISTKRAGVAAEERHLVANTCEALADATAVILALSLVPPTDAPFAEPKARAKPFSPADVPADKTDVAQDAYAHLLAVNASLIGDALTLPSPALGGRVGVAWTPNRARIELAGSYFAGQSKTTETTAAGADLTLLTVGARGCWAFLRSAIELSPCIGADLQRIQARGYGALTSNYDTDVAWFSAAAGALARVPVTRWLALRADADLVVPLSSLQFVVEADGVVHDPTSIGIRGGIGAEVFFLNGTP